jgi:hypothetical protein
MPAAAGLVIHPTFDGTIAGDANAATIEATINQAIQSYQARLADPITVEINFKEMNTGLGQSSTWISSTGYGTFLSQLQADKTTAADNTALAHLPVANPINGNPIALSVANFKALGFSVGATPDGFDGTISLNTSIINLDRTSIDSAKYDLQAVVQHEIDEVLGFSSGVGEANIRPSDLFRYDQNGDRSFTTDPAAQSFFSIDGGTTRLARFNQTAGGDYGDWFSTGLHVPQVQDAFGTPGSTPDLDVEFTALDVIGYDLNPAAVPEPSSLVLLGSLGLVASGAGYLRKRRGQPAAA